MLVICLVNSFQLMILNFRNKRLLKWITLIIIILLSVHPSFAKKKRKKEKRNSAITVIISGERDSVFRKPTPFDLESRKNTEEIIRFAKLQLGTPYKYGSSEPGNGGLDCSGFLYYVFQHFKISVPRSSFEYMNFGKTLNIKEAKQGDVIVFTSTDATQKTSGHVGIILENKKDDIIFIHCSSGKTKGVTISKLSEGYYHQRFLKIVRVFN